MRNRASLHIQTALLQVPLFPFCIFIFIEEEKTYFPCFSGEVSQPAQPGLHLLHLHPAGLLHQVLPQLPPPHKDQPGGIPCRRRNLQFHRITVQGPQRDECDRFYHQRQRTVAPLQRGGGTEVSAFGVCECWEDQVQRLGGGLLAALPSKTCPPCVARPLSCLP